MDRSPGKGNLVAPVFTAGLICLMFLDASVRSLRSLTRGNSSGGDPPGGDPPGGGDPVPPGSDKLLSPGIYLLWLAAMALVVLAVVLVLIWWLRRRRRATPAEPDVPDAWQDRPGVRELVRGTDELMAAIDRMPPGLAAAVEADLLSLVSRDSGRYEARQRLLAPRLGMDAKTFAQLTGIVETAEHGSQWQRHFLIETLLRRRAIRS